MTAHRRLTTGMPEYVWVGFEAQLGLLVAPEPPERPEHALLGPADVQGCRSEVHLIPQRRSTSSDARGPCR